MPEEPTAKHHTTWQCLRLLKARARETPSLLAVPRLVKALGAGNMHFQTQIKHVVFFLNARVLVFANQPRAVPMSASMESWWWLDVLARVSVILFIVQPKSCMPG